MGTVTNVIVGVAKLYIKYPIGGNYVDVGFTEDGVKVEYSVSKINIKVEELSYPIKSVIDTEEFKVTANLAEATMRNLFLAMAGASQVGNAITIGNSLDKEMSVKIVSKNPAGFDRTIEIPVAVASGSVSLSSKLTQKTVVPVTFEAMMSPSGVLATINDATS